MSVAVWMGACLCSAAAFAQELITVNHRLVVKQPLPLIEATWGDAVVFPEAFGDRFLQQCSRSTLGKGDSYWRPTKADINKAEAIFCNYRVRNKPGAALEKWPDLRKYHRQYIGVVRGDKKSLYANYQPAGGIGENDWRHQPLELCDGGPHHFGVEIDPVASRIEHIAFDGCMCRIERANTYEASACQ